MKLIDTHAHLNFSQFQKDRDEIICRAQKSGVVKIIDVGCDFQSSRQAIKLAQANQNIWATVGIHPSEIEKVERQDLASLRELAQTEKVVAIGEVGLDYFSGKENRIKQKEIFVAQIKIARELNLPLIIHTRDAGKDLLKILKQEKPDKLVIHCFTENRAFAEAVLAMGSFISLTGIITYPNASALRQVVQNIPLERIMLETDSPYLAPQKYRGKRNKPAYVLEVARMLAEIKGISPEEVAEITTKNAEKFFVI